MTDRELLEMATRNYRDLADAVAALWDHVEPYLAPGTAPHFDHSEIQPTPAHDLELMARAIVESLQWTTPRSVLRLHLHRLIGVSLGFTKGGGRGQLRAVPRLPGASAR